MSMMRTEKLEKTTSLEQVLGQAKGTYLANFQGMTVEALSELRKRCRKSDVRIEVVKNTLLRRAAQATGAEGLMPGLKGPTALVTSAVDEIIPAKILVDFAKEHKGIPAIKMGLIGGRPFTETQVKEAALLPPKDVLLGQFVGTLQSPLQRLASAITSPLRDLVGVLNALSEKKGSIA